MDRRDLLQWMLATGGMAAMSRLDVDDLLRVGEAAHGQLATRPARQPQPPSVRGLTPDEHAVVTAAAECIIPRTDTPGATDARVADFVEVMLADWYPAAESARFRAGLGTLDQRSTAVHGVRFASASAAQQVALVQQFDDEVTALRTQRAASANAHWFAVLKYLTVWGFCTSEVGMREVLGTHPRPSGYDGSAPVR